MNNTEIQELISNYNKLTEHLKRMLKKCRNGKQRRLATRILFGGISACIATIIVFLLLERTPAQSETIRYIISVTFWFIATFTVGETILRYFKKFSDVSLSVEIEQYTKKFNSELSSAAEFISKKSEDKTSNFMKHLTIASAGKALNTNDIKAMLKQYSPKKYFITMISLATILLIWYSFSPLEVKIGINRITQPFAKIDPWSNLEFIITPKDFTSPTGSNVEISALPSRFITEPVYLILYDLENSEGKTVTMYKSGDNQNKMVYVLSTLQESLEYRIKCEKYISEKYKITVMPRPQIAKLQVTMYQPEYISKDPIALPVNTGDCTILAGSKIKIQIEADQKLKSANILLQYGDKEVKEEIATNLEEKFEYEFKVATNTAFSILMENELGLTNENPVIYNITAKIDEPPTVDLLKPGMDMPFPTTKMLELKANSKDDYGIHTMVLYYMAGNRNDWITINMKPDFTPMPEYETIMPWMLDTVYAMPGTKISYYVQVEDAKTPTPNVATTTTYYINMPSMHDLYRGEEAKQKKITEQLTNYIKAQKARKQALMQAYEQIRHEEKLDFETEKAIEKALEEGEKQQKIADEMIEELKDLEKAMENNPFTSPEALEKMQKVNELLNEVLDDKTKRMMEQLRKSLEEIKLNPEDIAKYEEAFKMEDYIKGLDRTIDLLNQVREQQKYNSMANAIEDIFQRQEYIASETQALSEKQQKEGLTNEEKALLQDLTDQQTKLGKELKELQKQAEEMTKKSKDNKENQNPLDEDVKNIRDKMQNEDFSKNNEEIKNSMRNQELASAAEQQKKMLKFLESLKKDAQNMNNMMNSQSSHTQLDLSAFIIRALQVSKDQEKLYDQISDMPSRFLRGKMPEIEGIIDSVSILQILIKQQGSELERDLNKMVQSSFNVDPTAIEAIKDTQISFAAIVKNLEDRALDDAWNDQINIIRRFNKLAVDLMRAQDQSNSQSSSSQQMSAMQMFKNLTRRQLSLYQQMMKQQLMPGSAGMQQMRQMAMEQRHIREALEKLMRENQRIGNRGDMSDIIADMKDVETKILDPALQRKAAEKQKSIYDKMMQAQKSIKNRDEEDEERQATKSKEILHQDLSLKNITNIGSNTTDLSKDFITDMNESYPKAYKDLINDYYKSLNIYGGSSK